MTHFLPSRFLACAKRAIALALAVVLSCMALPAFAAEPADDAYSGDPKVGSHAAARSVEELLSAGEYREGRVIAHVNSGFGVPRMRSANAAIETSDLYSLSATSSSEADAGEPSAFSLQVEPGDRVVLVSSDSLSTEELLRYLADVPGVSVAEPDYVWSLDGEAGAVEGAGLQGVETPSVSEGDSTGNSVKAEATAGPVSDDALLDRQWHLKSTDEAAGGAAVLELWNRLGLPAARPSGDPVVIAVLDSSVDYTNPDLKNAMWAGGKSVDADSGEFGYDFFDNDDDPMDEMGHGTHVAGIVAATADNGIGGAGVDPNARIMALKVMNSAGQMNASSVVEAYDYMKNAVCAGVSLAAVNNSWGGQFASVILNEVIDDLYRTYGVLSVCASGNSAMDHDLSIDGPSGLPSSGIIAVNAVGESGELASFSDFGTASTDVAAPGEDILSTVLPQSASADLGDPGIVLVQDTYERGQKSLFAFSPQGDASAVLEYDDFAWPGGGAPECGLAWRISSAQAGQEASLVSAPVDLTGMFDAGDYEHLHLAFNAGVTDSRNSGTGRIVHVYLSTADPEKPWVELSPAVSQGVSYGEGGTLALSVPPEVKGTVDWANLSIKITRTLVAFDEGLDIDFRLDDVSFIKEVSPFNYLSGTSMAAPVVTGAVALLKETYPDEDAQTIRARILGGVKRTDALAGTCTSDGQLDVMRAAHDPYPVVDAVVQNETDATRAAVEGSWFGNERGTVTVDGVQVEVVSWSESRIEIVLPSTLETAPYFVEVATAADPEETGRHRLFIESTRPQPARLFYDDLPAPDLKALGAGAPAFTETPWTLVEAGGKLYATCTAAGCFDSDGELYLRVLVFDPQTSVWSVEHAFDAVPYDNVSLSSSGTNVYLLTNTDRLLYRFDAVTGTMAQPVECKEGFDAVAPSFVVGAGGSTCDGSTLRLYGGVDLGSGTGSATVDVVCVDVDTGKVERGDDLQKPRAFASSEQVGKSEIVAAGVPSVKNSGVQDSLEVRCNGQTRLVAFPDGIPRNQHGFIAAGVVPANVSAPGEATAEASETASGPHTGERLVLAGLSSEGADGPDTFVFDPSNDSFTPVSTRLSPHKVAFAGGVVQGSSFYVLGVDTSEGTFVFKRLSLVEEEAPADPVKPVGEGESLSGGAGSGVSPATLAAAGDSAAGAVAALMLLAGVSLCLVGASARRRRVR